MNVLVVEDERKVATFIRRGLELHGFKADLVMDGNTAALKGLSTGYDVILMDANLPEMSGFTVCQQLREKNVKTPILMLTALGTTQDKVLGFEKGADDYLVKPFEFEELLARIKSLIKRYRSMPLMDNIIHCADLELHRDSRLVKRGSQILKLTAKEFLLLEFLMRNKGKVISRAEIAEKIWGISFDTGTNVIDVYIYYLRNKVDKGFDKKLIQAVSGTGYCIGKR